MSRVYLAGPPYAEEYRRRADARRQVIDQPLRRRQLGRVRRRHHHAQRRQPGQALAQLLDRGDAGRLARQELLDLAGQVAVEVHQRDGRGAKPCVQSREKRLHRFDLHDVRSVHAVDASPTRHRADTD